MITLTLRAQPTVPLEADCITPDNFRSKTVAEIARLTVSSGNASIALGDVFAIAGDSTEEIVIEGDLSRVSQIGAKMMQGQIVVHGDVGMHLGAGMRGGMIIVEGNAGNQVGAMMRRGLIAVLGDVGDLAGESTIAGSIIVFGRLGVSAGAGMKRGSLVTFHSPELLPTFRYDCVYQPSFLRLMLQNLRALGVAVRDEYLNGYYRRYSGDMNALGKGEILVYDQR
jgi:formylmethanofuran dehydrogenase subunit C